jgi:Domain of unknown function (DUF4351)
LRRGLVTFVCRFKSEVQKGGLEGELTLVLRQFTRRVGGISSDIEAQAVNLVNAIAGHPD